MSMTTVFSTSRTARAEYSVGDSAKRRYLFRSTAGATANAAAPVAKAVISSRRENVAERSMEDGRSKMDGGWQTAGRLGMGRMYAELHCHSTFSLLDGAAHPEQLVARAVQLGMPALALTDRDDLGGAVRFSTAAATAGLKGIIGVELTVEMTAAGTPAGGREQGTG